MVWRRTYPGTRDQASNARKFTESLFAGTGREDDAGLIIAELVGNALLYTDSGKPGGWFGIEIALEDLSYLAVTDLGGAGAPAIGQTQTGHEPPLGGRGLLIVSELSLTVGVHGSPALGHTVWSDLDLTAKEQTSLLAC
jgi:hypothetical protein